MHPYGMYMTDCEVFVPFNLGINGFSGMLATRILGEAWNDNYANYSYTEGDEKYMEMLLSVTEEEFKERFDTYLEDDEYGEQEY